MGRFKCLFSIVKNNLATWKKNDRFMALWILSIVLVWAYMSHIIIYAVKNGGSVTPFFLPLLFGNGRNSNGSFKVLFFFCAILLLCKIPVMNEQKLLVIQRSGRRKWWQGECLYLVIASFIYLSIFSLFSMLLLLPHATWNLRDWGDLVIQGVYNPQIGVECFVGLPISAHMIEKVAPVSAWLYTFLVVWVDMVILGLVIYAINLHSDKDWLGIVVAMFMVLIDPIMNSRTYGASRALLIISPINWSSIANLREYSGMGILTLPLVSLGILVFILFLMIIIAIKTEKMDITYRIGG